jgi:DNA-binding response OmpR family regulator
MALQEILLVDKNTPIISAIGYILQSEGFQVVLAPDAETAFEDLNNYYFDLLLVYLTGYEEDKLDLLRQAKRRAPWTKVILAGNPRKLNLPIEAFQVEVDDYLLTPFDAPELCRRVKHCLNMNEVLKAEADYADKTVSINERVLEALRLKFCEIQNTLCSLIANFKNMIRKNPYLLNNCDMSHAYEASNDLLKLLNITEDFLYHQLLLSHDVSALKSVACHPRPNFLEVW